jgi:hypothetical protein
VFDQLSFLASEPPHLTVTINIPSPDDDTIPKLKRLLSEQAEADGDNAPAF